MNSATSNKTQIQLTQQGLTQIRVAWFFLIIVLTVLVIGTHSDKIYDFSSLLPYLFFPTALTISGIISVSFPRVGFVLGFLVSSLLARSAMALGGALIWTLILSFCFCLFAASGANEGYKLSRIQPSLKDEHPDILDAELPD